MSARPDRTPLDRSFFDRPVLTVAPDLLGRTLVRRTPDGPMELRITEVEAYEGEADPGSHAYRGPTARNASMFGPPGHAYVYFIYGMWFSLNLVCGPPGHASGVLLRAGEVTLGAELARTRRLSARADRELAQGPARLATALDIDRSLDGTDLCAGPDAPLSLLSGTRTPPDQVGNGPRTGVGGAGADHPYRYWITHDPTVSRYRAHAPRRRST
ncbi:DNA-3-methyladenine glycosylase [Streptomyces sp. NPDC006544]|uniref:DNA-3-methyladenine glycosylase n=1 Tax=Streptomyces sp. NPDC006544 TaxID=3154583 RepID=UPI0033B9C8D2